MARKKIVFVVLPLLILSFFANAQIIGFRLAANSGVLLSEFGPSDVSMYPAQNPAQSTERFTPQPTIGFEGELLFQISPNSFFGIEGDWHDIPSIRGMIKHDLKRVKSKVKEVLPDVEKGMYFNVKEAFKKVMPHEYAALKELKDILIDRNAVKNI